MGFNPSAFPGVLPPGNGGTGLTVQSTNWTPADNGLQYASGPMDAYANNTTGALTAGTVYLIRINIVKGGTVSNVFWPVSTAGTGASTQTFTGLYSFAGALLVGSADISAQLSVTPALCPLSSSQVFAGGGFVWAALLCNFATTQPVVFRAGGVGSLTFYNAFQNASSFRYATHNVGALTALPATITAQSAGGQPMFAGLA